MTKVIPLERWIRMSQPDKDRELREMCERLRGSGARMIRRETLFEFFVRKLFR